MLNTFHLPREDSFTLEFLQNLAQFVAASRSTRQRNFRSFQLKIERKKDVSLTK